ncbi:N-acetyltransferase family protein [Robbsia sp. KACC 23696]|uniref:GNAT family N-acetyltransferase n=1 Tax=Robbsia sp. KACC 23696 TaxID=3149231 RepID=UPI00325A8B2B
MPDHPPTALDTPLRADATHAATGTCDASAIAIRAATPADMVDVARIYAPYVLSTTISFETEAPSVETMVQRHRDIVAAGAPYLVAVMAGRVVGYAYAGPYKARAAYRFTVEHSVYLDGTVTGRGLGRRLLESLIAACRAAGIQEMIATVAGDDNAASLGVHARCGFVPIGRLRNVGFKYDRWIDVTLMQLSLRDTVDAASPAA